VGFMSLQCCENIASVRRNECKVTCEMFQDGVVVLEGFEYKCLKYSKLWVSVWKVVGVSASSRS
jgi:hypothetical protein